MRGPSGSTINYIITGITVTMDTPITSTSISIVPGSLVVGSIVTYTFTLDQAIDIHETNDYLVIDVPALMTLPTTITCTTIAGITSVSCLRSSATSLKVIYNADPTATLISFSFGGMENYRVADTSVSFSFKIYNQGNYQMEQKTTGVTYTESIITSAALNHDDNIALGEESNITITLTNSFSLYGSFDAALTVL